MGNNTSLIIPVAEAAFVQPFRERYQHGAGASMPPHITARAPFKQMHELVFVPKLGVPKRADFFEAQLDD